MTEREINEKVRAAYTHAAPDIQGAALPECGGGRILDIAAAPPRKAKRWVRQLAAAAACLCLCAGALFGVGGYRADRAVDAIVSLDVNPSVEIRVNRKERVLSVTPLNQDGEVIVGDMDFSGSSLDVAVNALIGSMLQNGYLSELANSVLISVDNRDEARGAALQERLTEQVGQQLESGAFSGAVLSQTVNGSGELAALAQQNGITKGKAQLIQAVLAEYPLHTFEELAGLSINELNLLLHAQPEVSAQVEAVGTASDKAYIGRDRAREIALAAAGVRAEDLAEYEIELDTHRGAIIYDVEFTTLNGDEYDCEIDAATGSIVKFEEELRAEPAQPQPSPGTGAGTGTGTGSGTAAGAGGNGTLIGKDKAREIALIHAGVSAGAVTEYEIELDMDDGVTVYEIDVKAGGWEYEYENNAATGAILDADREKDD